MAGTSAHCSPSRSAGERKRRLTTDSATHATSARFPARLDPPRWQDVPSSWLKQLPHQRLLGPRRTHPAHLTALFLMRSQLTARLSAQGGARFQAVSCCVTTGGSATSSSLVLGLL